MVSIGWHRLSSSKLTVDTGIVRFYVGLLHLAVLYHQSIALRTRLAEYRLAIKGRKISHVLGQGGMWTPKADSVNVELHVATKVNS